MVFVEVRARHVESHHGVAVKSTNCDDISIDQSIDITKETTKSRIP